MPSKKRATPVSLQPLDALFGTNEETTNGISEIAIGSLHPFTNHPFQVRDDKKMEELAESITQYGVLVPGIVRLLVSMLVTVLGLVNKLPVVGPVNRGLGWLVGGGTALMDLYLVLCVVWGLVVITGGSLSVLNDTVMSGSLYYKVFNLFNPFL